MHILDETVKDYFYCKIKASYKFKQLKISNESFYYFEKYLAKQTNKVFKKNIYITSANFKNISKCEVGKVYSVENTIPINGHMLKYDYFEIDKNNCIVPIFISNSLELCIEEKKYYAFKSKQLEKLIAKPIYHFKIVLYDGKIKKVKIQGMKIPDIVKITDKKLEIQKKSHCNICEYKSVCYKKLKKEDDLRLLSSMSESEVLKLNKKGCFTIQQYSYSYRPRRRSLITSSKSRYKFELKSLAIRNQKTYIAENIVLNSNDIEVFVDFETLPSENYVYLIGILTVKEDQIIDKLSYWADSQNEEQVIFEKLFSYIRKIGNCAINHYGSFEIKELKKFNKKHNNEYTSDIEYIIDNSNNILEYFYSNIYPPTYSNSLKDIANHIGFNWTKKSSSGLSSIIWRKMWDFKKSKKIKNKLILYNVEDCLSLYHVKTWIMKLKNGKESSESLGEIFNHSGFKFGKQKFNIQSFESINQTAYFDYQTKKIFIRDKNYKHEVKKVKKIEKTLTKENTTEYSVPPIRCPLCSNMKMYKHQIYMRYIIDLKFTKAGIKRWIIKYKEYRYRCSICNKTVTISNYNSKYGRNLKIWILYQIFIYNLSYRDIVKMLFELFSIQINGTTILNLKEKYSAYLEQEYKNILDNIINGNLLHIDETTVTIDKRKQYVWVLTNLTQIYYIHREDRTTKFLIDILKEFKGVMISDFYTAYDGLEVIQQKCLIHLMRDINDLIFKNPEDTGLIEIGKLYGDILSKIVNTIDKYGLKKRNLNKHKKDVNQFYKKIDEYNATSDESIKLKKRFTKYKSKLFTFLDYDGIPWNNNNVEHAIKEFAKYRHKTDRFYTKKSLQNHLKILSIQQSCTYQNINFLDYLKSNFPESL